MQDVSILDEGDIERLIQESDAVDEIHTLLDSLVTQAGELVDQLDALTESVKLLSKEGK